MPSHSLSPIRRAQGYLTAQIEWRFRIDYDPYERFHQICEQEGKDNVNPLQPGNMGLRPKRLADRQNWIIARLRQSNIKAPFCRGYLFALVEKEVIHVDVANGVMVELQCIGPNNKDWLAQYPPAQSHPLYPFSPKVDATWGSPEDKLLAAILGR